MGGAYWIIEKKMYVSYMMKMKDAGHMGVQNRSVLCF